MFQASKIRSSVALALFGVCLNVQALPTDKDQPIYVAADRASIDENKGITIYTGEVEITQGSMVLKGDRVELYRDSEGAVDRIISNGEPAYFEQQPEVDQAITYATGKILDYKVANQLLLITENARVEQGGDEFTGAKIEYDMDKALVDAFSDQDQNKRVRMVIQPSGNAN